MPRREGRKGRAGVVGAIGVMSLLVTTGCSATDRAPATTESDSAGIVIVRNPDAGSLPEPRPLAVETVVAPAADRPETLFGFVAGLVVDEDGHLYAFDQQAQAIHVFRPDGSHRETLGGPGEGPGEIGRLATSLLIRADTVMVSDWLQSRMNRYGTDGSVLESRPLPVPPGARSWWRTDFERRIWFRALRMSTGDDGTWQSEDLLLRVRDDAAVGVEAVARADTVYTFEYTTSDLGARGAPKLPIVVNAPTWTILRGDRVAWTTLDGSRLRIDRLGSTGDPERIVTGPAPPPREPTLAEQEAFLRAMGDRLESLGGQRSAVETMPVEQPIPLPVWTFLRARDGRQLWAQRVGDPVRPHPMGLNTPDPPVTWGGPIWDVFDENGVYVESVRLPVGFRLYAFTGDAAYGVVADELGQESLVRVTDLPPH